MPANTTPIFTKASRWGGAKIVAADTTALKTVFTAGEFGSRVHAVLVSNSSAVAIHAYLWVETAGLHLPVSFLSIAAGAGVNGTAQPGSMLTDGVTPFLQRDANDTPYLDLPPGAVLKVRAGTTVASGTSTFVNSSETTELGPNALSITVNASDY